MQIRPVATQPVVVHLAERPQILLRVRIKTFEADAVSSLVVGCQLGMQLRPERLRRQVYLRSASDVAEYRLESVYV